LLWKLWDENIKNEFQERMLQQALQDKSHLYVLETCEWKIPIHQYSLQVTSSTKMKIDILKKMIMYAMINMRVSNLLELSLFLHVDELFVTDIIDQMVHTGVVEILQGEYQLTSIGHEQFKAGTILSEPSIETITYEWSPLNSGVLLEEPANVLVKEDWELEEYRYSSNFNRMDNQVLDQEELRDIIKQSGKIFEVGGNEKIISKISPISLTAVKYAKCIEFQLYDIIENTVYARVWNGAQSRWDEKFESELAKIEGHIWKAQYDEAIIANFPERYDYLRNKLKGLADLSKKTNNKELEILRGKEIRDKFISSFQETKRKMLMVSPWISNIVVDREMLSRLQEFAKQGKTLYISWGIAKSIEQEDRQPSKELLNTLNSIKHNDGTQAVFVRWFGNQHNKEIIMDTNTHLLGSYNWLSYRGEYDIRHESVVVMRDKKIIRDTTEYIEEKFIHDLEVRLAIILTEEIATIESKQLVNWMKELILLDSAFDRRKGLSNQLVDALKTIQREEVRHEIACLWVRYDGEDFGVRSYLRELLIADMLEQASEFHKMCQMHIPTSGEWKNSPELKEFSDWLNLQSPLVVKKKETKVKKQNKKYK
jgi:hypothetical protein